MKIYVFSPTLETLGIAGKFESLTHTRQFAGSGKFKLKAPFTPELFRLLVEENILYWEDAGRPRAVYIESVICELEKKGEFITASGKNLRGLLGRRIVWNNFIFSGSVEDFCRRAVAENATSPTDVSAASAVGFDVTLNKAARRLYFTAYEGTDRRTTQTATPWVIVSRDRNNVVSEVYTRSGASSRNTALISGYTDEETGARYEKAIVAGSGLSRREIFVKGSSSKPKPDKDTGETEAQALARYADELLQKGREKLAKQVDVLSLEVELDPLAVAVLDVGDKVTAIERQYGLTAQTYVSEITAYYEQGGTSYDVTLGDAVPSIYKKLEKEIV